MSRSLGKEKVEKYFRLENSRYKGFEAGRWWFFGGSEGRFMWLSRWSWFRF